MGIARGILSYGEAVKAEADRRDAIVLDLLGKYGATSLAGLSSTRSGSRKKSSGSAESDLIYIQDKYNISDEALAAIVAANDPAAIPNLKNILDGYSKKYGADNLSVPTDLVNQIIEEAAIVLPGEVDVNEINKLIGFELKRDYSAAIDMINAAQTGSVTYGDIIYAEQPTQGDINQLEKNLFNNALLNLRQQKYRASQLINSINSEESPTEEKKMYRDMLMRRNARIDDALDQFQKKNPSDLIVLFGNEYIPKMLEDPQNQKFKNVTLSGIFTDPAIKYPLVTNKEEARLLISYGIIPNNIIVRYPDGKTERVGVNLD